MSFSSPEVLENMVMGLEQSKDSETANAYTFSFKDVASMVPLINSVNVAVSAADESAPFNVTVGLESEQLCVKNNNAKRVKQNLEFDFMGSPLKWLNF